MRYTKKIIMAVLVGLPLLGVAASSQTDQAVDNTKKSANEWGDVAKQKLQQGEAAAKKQWPKVEQKTNDLMDRAKQTWEGTKKSWKESGEPKPAKDS
ncbi:MAG: hypothetical protein P1U34_09635 [Coxiellaceae bacterium]|nr:hypothetical protein [Coxiellaceae bacterium]